VWDVIFTPFGTTAYVNQNPTVMDIRFPGQWFQLETGLAYNWHRHYDATTGRYAQPDPLVSDNGHASIAGLPNAWPNEIAQSVGKLGPQISPYFGTGELLSLTMRLDGPSIYGYAKQTPLTRVDLEGLVSGNFSSIPRLASSCEKPIVPVGDFCSKVTSFKGGGLDVYAVYDCGGFRVFANVGQRIAPLELSIESPIIQGGNILNDNNP
jgi:RHS repeat-associated protein